MMTKSGGREPSKKKCSWWRMAFGALVLVGGAALAAPPQMARDRVLTVRIAAQAAESRLFELSRLAVPLCAGQVAWRLGPSPLALADPTRDEFARQVHERWLPNLTFGPGERIFVSQQFNTPYAQAGVKPGDRMLATDLIGVAAGGQVSVEPPEPAASLTFQQRRQAESKALEAQPQRLLTVQRGGNTLHLVARAVQVCDLQLLPLDSQYVYADILGKAIVATVPLLSRVDDIELTMVLAHEAAQRMLGNEGKHGRSMMAQLLVPKAVQQIQDFRRNIELDAEAPSEEELIEADRLTLRLLVAYGISPADYLAFLQRMQSDEAPKAKAPVYSRTRALGERRKAALQAVVAGAELAPPTGIELSRWTALETQGAALRAAQALTLPAPVAAVASVSAPAPSAASPLSAASELTPALAPKRHRLPVPPASGFAAGTDAEAVPISSEGQERYRHYLTLKSPKAFVVYLNGGWRFFWNQSDAMTMALNHCAREGKTCWLYAVDDHVVWQADIGKRIGSSAQLHHGADGVGP